MGKELIKNDLQQYLHIRNTNGKIVVRNSHHGTPNNSMAIDEAVSMLLDYKRQMSEMYGRVVEICNELRLNFSAEEMDRQIMQSEEIILTKKAFEKVFKSYGIDITKIGTKKYTRVDGDIIRIIVYICIKNYCENKKFNINRYHRVIGILINRDRTNIWHMVRYVKNKLDISDKQVVKLYNEINTLLYGE